MIVPFSHRSSSFVFSTASVTGILVCLLLSFLAGCSGNDVTTGGRDHVVPVVTDMVARRDVPRTLTAVGNVQAAASVAVKPQVGGQIVAAPVVAGQDVSQGQVLFQIDPRPYEATVNEVAARLTRNQVLLKKALEDQARFSRLVRQDAVSRESYDQAVANAESQRALVVQDEASLASAKLQLEYATVKAPVSGRVGEVLIDAGNVVKANDDRTLLVINTLAPAKIIFAVPERHLAEIMAQFQKKDLTVTATPEGFTDTASTGKLVSIDNAVDTTTGTIKLESRFENKDHMLWPGQFVRIRVNMDTLSNALVVNAAAVLEGVIGQYVYVINKDSMAEVRRVKARYISEKDMLVEDGLTEGERVAVDGQLNLAAGIKVMERNRDGSPTEPARTTGTGSGKGQS